MNIMIREFPIEDDIIKASLDTLFKAERSLIAKRAPEAVIEEDDTPFLWLCLQPPYTPTLSHLRRYVGYDDEPYFVLAGLLGLSQRTTPPPGFRMQGLSIRIEGNNADFCISGSVSLDDLETLRERFLDQSSKSQCKR
jgi:hypothetical protein